MAQTFRKIPMAISSVFGAFLIALTLGAVTGSAPAAAHTATFELYFPDGFSMRLTSDPQHMSVDDLMRAGVRPGFHGVRLAHSIGLPTNSGADSSPDSLAAPRTAKALCNQKVCEDVYGKNLQVTDWDSIGRGEVTGCFHGDFWEPANTIWAMGTTNYCNDKPYIPYAWVGKWDGIPLLPHSFPNNSYACATLSIMPGKPCARVYQRS